MRGIFAWLGVVVIGLASSMVLAAGEGPESLKGQKAPEIALKTLDGKSVMLSSMKGKVVLVDMWATWCPPCRKSLPHVQEVSANRELAGQGLVVWAVNAAEEPGTVRKFLDENKYTFTVPMDAQRQVGKAYQVRGIPTTLIVGRDGKVADVFVGFGDGSAEKIDAAI
jgi:thiol-disulfide isomerase/thioredoxin